jgi:hypothetical protein
MAYGATKYEVAAKAETSALRVIAEQLNESLGRF